MSNDDFRDEGERDDENEEEEKRSCSRYSQINHFQLILISIISIIDVRARPSLTVLYFNKYTFSNLRCQYFPRFHNQIGIACGQNLPESWP